MQRDPKALGKVAVLFGGASSERDVSIMSGQGVGVDAHAFDPSTDSLERLRAERFDRAFIALHGRLGEDGCAQGLLELLGIAYTGSSLAASALAMDKIMTKRIWQSVGLPTPAWCELPANATDAQLTKAAQQVGLPLIFKAPHEGSSLGLAKVNEQAQLRTAFDSVAKFDSTVLVEQFITGRELTVAVLQQSDGHRALPIIEIKAPGGNYDYNYKYFSNDTIYDCPAQLPAALTAQVLSIAETAFAAIGCSGWGRVDFLLDAANQPFLLEINTAPGMTSHSLVPMAAKAVGINYAQLCFDICLNARLYSNAKSGKQS
jgi:D-alanine-D-alanine ligase